MPPSRPPEPTAIMRSVLSILSIMALLVGCQKQSPTTTAASTNMTPEQFGELFKQETSKADAWFAALDAAKPSAPFVVEFLRLFPGAVVNYRYFTSTHEPGYDVEVDLHERYELTMQLPVLFDPGGRTVVGYGEPKFFLKRPAKRGAKHPMILRGSFISVQPNGERLSRTAEIFWPLATG
jgi:hypothetical protein